MKNQNTTLAYALVTENDSKVNRFIHMNKREEARQQIADAVKQNLVPQDLLLEMSLRQNFLNTQKGLKDNKNFVNDFLINNKELSKLESRSSLKNNKKNIKQRYLEYQQNQMEHEVYETEEIDELDKFKQDDGIALARNEHAVSIEQLLGYNSVDKSRQNLARIPTDDLLEK